MFGSLKSRTCTHHLCVFASSSHRSSSFQRVCFCVLFSLTFPFCTPTATFSFDLLVLLPTAGASMSTNPPSPRAEPKDLYAWTSRELLDECSSLLSSRALREHVGEPCTYDHRAFAKRHDDDIAVLPCTLGEPVCRDESANNGVPFFYFYQVVFKSVSVRLPFSRFERELLTKINAALAHVSILKYLVVQSLTWALECDRPQRRRSVLLQVHEVDRDEGRRLKRCTRRSKFDEARSNVLVNRQDHQAPTVGPCKTEV